MAIQFEYIKQISARFFQQKSPCFEVDSKDLVGKRVLLVEDNRVHQLMIGTMLKNLGMIFEVADNGKIAIEKLKNGHYDIVLMDIQMPVMNGLEATKLLRQDEKLKKIPIVGMSAGTMQEEQGETVKSGMNGFLSKPIDLIKFTSELLNACSISR